MKTLDVEYDQVFIIDCLPTNQYDEWKISQDLMQYLADKGVKQTTSICKNKNILNKTFEFLIRLASNGSKFIIHIISHGNIQGLGFKETGEFITWEEFRNHLYNINNKMSDQLMVNMTSCFGIHGIKIVNECSPSYPFFGLIGYESELNVVKAKNINVEFYKNLLLGLSIPDSIEKLKSDLSDNGLYYISTQGYKKIRNVINQYR